MHTRHRRLRLALGFFGALLLALGLGCGGSGDDEEGSGEEGGGSVLSRVEDLAPETERSNFEPYERQLDTNRLVSQSRAAGQPVPSFLREQELPPTLTDVLMHDFWMTANVDLDMGVLDQSVTAAQMTRIIDFYVQTSDSNIRGYRPRAHKRFIMGLTPQERTQLATEAAEYVQENGFLGPPLQ